MHTQTNDMGKGTALTSWICALTLGACNPSAVLPAADYLGGRPKTDLQPIERVSRGWWDLPEGLQGQKRIVIDTRRQMAQYYVGSTLVGQTTVSTGTEGRRTPTGSFKVLAKDKNHVSSTYGELRSKATDEVVDASFTRGSKPIPAGTYYKGAAMTNGLQLTTSGIWMHAGFVTAAPESHGCIRLPADMAEKFFAATPVGTPVLIK
ncbi:MAG: L,D-transpeptidase [Akkermansia sp.]|nr:L,D-transpeptidase [Akkermansia sp.]